MKFDIAIVSYNTDFYLLNLHEIRPRLGADGSIAETWRDIKNRFGGEELLEREDQNGFGIGLIRVGDQS